MIREEVWTNFPRDLMAGALMGGVAHTIVAPIERAKLLLQTQESNLAITGGKHRRFKGMLDCIFRTVRDEGARSLWRGNGSSILRHYPSVALNFSLKDLYRSMLTSGQLHEKPLSKAPSNFLAGSLAGCSTLIIIYPLDIAHTRLAADIGKREARQFKGLFHFLKTIHQKEGLKGVYRGLPASLHGMIVHRGLYFGGFDTAKDMMLVDSPHIPFWKRWIVAQGVTTSAGLLSYPLDTVRRRMMMQSGLEHRMYKNTWDCWKKIYKREGATSFYRGAVSNMFRSTGAALILVLYDEMKNLMNWGVSWHFSMEVTLLGSLISALLSHLLLCPTVKILFYTPIPFEIPLTFVDKAGHTKKQEANIPPSQVVAVLFACSRSDSKGIGWDWVYLPTKGSYRIF